MMKLLINGVPKSGKSTLINELLLSVDRKRGFVTDEVVSGGKRTGFVLRDNQGRSSVLAQTHEPTQYAVGRFFVSPEALDDFLLPLQQFSNNELLYVDEIGQMQLYSRVFRKLVEQYLKSSNDFMGTISSVYEDDLTEYIRKRKDVIVFALDANNRSHVSKAIKVALERRGLFNTLPSRTRISICDLARKYIDLRQYDSLYKLFNNTIVYVHDKRLSKIDNRHFEVKGFTANHIVALLPNEKFECDCPLFVGEGNGTKECSHIQSVMLCLA